MRLKIFCLLAVLLVSAEASQAAEIYGQIRLSSNQVPSTAVVNSSCGGAQKVDSFGRYRITSQPAHETCTLSVHYQQMQSNPVNIYTADQRNSANFELRISGDRLLLIRR